MGNIEAKMNYQALLAELYQEEIKNGEVSLVDVGLGGRFNNITELQ